MSKGPWRRPLPKREVLPLMGVDELPYICTTGEAARFFRCRPEQIQRKAIRGEIRGYKEGKEWRFRRDDLLDYLNRQLGLGDAG